MLQLQVITYDSSYPDNQATTTLSVSININPGNIRFQPLGSYSFQVNESEPVRHVVGSVFAEDSDGVSPCLLELL